MPNVRRSFVWNYFTKNHDGEVQCDMCNKKINVYGSSTTNMIKHLHSKHRDLNLDMSNSANNDNGDMKEEYIVLQGENSDSFLVEHDKSTGVEEMPSFRIIQEHKMKKEKWSRVDNQLRDKQSNSNVSMKNEGDEQEESLDFFLKYAASLMKKMSKRKCQETQFELMSVIMKRMKEENQQNEDVLSVDSKDNEQRVV